ncbi:MAG: glutamyl-tRNA reductase [Chloroflexi bacterium]|nr:glutamyl-tRNA reductase [Chloroflexota bacterium]
MAIVAIGLSHKTAPVELREQLAIPAAKADHAMDALKSALGKSVLLSTCNRTEVYTTSETPEEGIALLERAMTSFCSLNPKEVGRLLYRYADGDAVRHLFRVSSGLESMILGEAQILGQVRDAYSAASERRMTDVTLSRLFHAALRVGKQARHETAIGRSALSISRAAVQMARRSLGSLDNARVLVVGLGEAGKLVARALADVGASRITVANRTYERAAELAQELGGVAIPLADLEHGLEQTDIVITATSTPDYLLTPALVARARATTYTPLVLIDIAVPRDIDPAVKELPGVSLYDIDDLETVAEANRRSRQAEAVKVEGLVEAQAQQFTEWMRSREAVPTVVAISGRAERIRLQELVKLRKFLPDLTLSQQESLDAFSQAMLKKVLHPALSSLKEKRDTSYVQSARELFGLAEGSEGRRRSISQRAGPGSD